MSCLHLLPSRTSQIEDLAEPRIGRPAQPCERVKGYWVDPASSPSTLKDVHFDHLPKHDMAIADVNYGLDLAPERRDGRSQSRGSEQQARLALQPSPREFIFCGWEVGTSYVHREQMRRIDNVDHKLTRFEGISKRVLRFSVWSAPSTRKMHNRRSLRCHVEEAVRCQVSNTRRIDSRDPSNGPGHDQ